MTHRTDTVGIRAWNNYAHTPLLLLKFLRFFSPQVYCKISTIHDFKISASHLYQLKLPFTYTYKNTCMLLLISECRILVSICINILAGWRPCLSVVMVAQLSEADDVVCNDKRQWNGRYQLWQNIFISKWNKLERICQKMTYQFLERRVAWSAKKWTNKFLGVFLNIFSSVFHLRKKIWFYSSAFDILNLYTGLYFPSI